MKWNIILLQNSINKKIKKITYEKIVRNIYNDVIVCMHTYG